MPWLPWTGGLNETVHSTGASPGPHPRFLGGSYSVRHVCRDEAQSPRPQRNRSHSPSRGGAGRNQDKLLGPRSPERDPARTTLPIKTNPQKRLSISLPKSISVALVTFSSEIRRESRRKLSWYAKSLKTPNNGQSHLHPWEANVNTLLFIRKSAEHKIMELPWPTDFVALFTEIIPEQCVTNFFPIIQPLPNRFQLLRILNLLPIT